MLHLHDLLGIAAALAVILAMLRYGNMVNSRSLLWRLLMAPVWVGNKIRWREPPSRR